MKTIKPAKRTENVKYAVRDILLVAEKAKASGKKLLYLNIGDPILFDLKTPDFVIKSIVKALEEGKTGYAPSSGTADAIAAIKKDAEANGIKSIQEVFITNGGSEAIELALTALLDTGDNVLLPTPGYPLYTAVLSKLEAEANPYYLDEENGWQPDPEDIKKKINSRTRAIVLINPNNPTGSVCSREVAQKIADIAAEHNLVLFVDEIYDKLIFDGEKHVTTAALNSDVAAITFNGLSKVYVGPGLRMGWGIVSGPAEKVTDYVQAIQKLTRARLCASHPVMAAIAPSLQGGNPHLPGMMEKLKRRRDMTFEMLNAIPGISCVKPKGAFYAFPKLTNTSITDEQWCAKLIQETGVVTVPGSGFGQKPGTKHFRIVFLPQENVLKEAYTAIGNFMKSSL